MQKMTEKGLCPRIHLTPVHLCDDIANMGNIHFVYLPDMRIVVVFGGDLVVDCQYEKLSPRVPADIFHANDLLNQSMNRNKISCRIVVVAAIDIDIDIAILSSCS